MLKRVGALVGAIGLLAGALPILAAAPAHAVGVTAICAPQSGSLSVTVGDTIVIGVSGAGCVLQDTAGAGAVESQDLGLFLAVAAGSTTIQAFTSDDFGSYTNTWAVTVTAPEPSPSPTLTPPPLPTPTSTGSTATTSATTSSTPAVASSATPNATPVPLAPATASAPETSQQLRPKDVYLGEALEPGTLAFFDDKDHPLQLLDVSGDRDAVRVLNRGMNYSWQPANWQRLGYGDLCWSYAGYEGVTGLILPVATPPFPTVAADWSLSAAIVATSTGNRVYTDPLPGQVVTADGRGITALTLCARGTASPDVVGSAVAGLRVKGADNHGNGNIGGNVGTGQCRGNGNFKHGCQPQQVTWPTYSGGTGTTTRPTPTTTPAATQTATQTATPTATQTATPTATQSAATSSAEGDPLVPVCRATGDFANPYRLQIVRVSEITEGQGNRLYPTAGWTDILPPVPNLPDGQNWPVGAKMLFGTVDKCQVPGIGPQPEPTATPTSSTATVTPLPQPTFTETSPVTVATAVPQPTFTGFTSITPWPPLYPIPVPTQLIPTPTPRPSSATASPIATPPSPSGYPTPTPETATPSAITPTPFPTPPSPPPLPTPTAVPKPPYPTPKPMPDVPTLVPPLQPPSVALTAVIRVPVPDAAVASPTATPSTKPSPNVTATPTATPSPMTASPTATPVPTATETTSSVQPSPSSSSSSSATSAESTAVATTEPSATPGTTTTATGTVSFLLTNGPDNVTVTLPVSELLTLTNQGGVPGKVPAKGPDATDVGELANTGAAIPWLLLTGVALAGTGLVFLATARRGRIRLVLVIAATATGVTLSTTAAWSVASQERVFSAAQLEAARDWSAQSAAIGRLTFQRAGGEPVTGLNPVFVFDGIDDQTLAQGPGRYPGTAAIGARGNTAIAGHRTGWGSPFAELDALRSGDLITLDSPTGDLRTYVVDDVRLVAPDDTWVLADDPLGTGTSTLTLTTCDPPGVNTGRLVVLATLLTGSSPG